MTKLSLFIFLGLFSRVLGANILIFSGYGEGSHFFVAANIGKELINRGHNVTSLISIAYEERSREERYKDINFEIFSHKVSPNAIRARHDRITKKAFEGSYVLDIVFNVSHFVNEQIDDLESILNDHDLVRRLDDHDFDLALIDPYWVCALVVAERFARTHVSVMPSSWWNILSRLNGNPVNPAHHPELPTGFNPNMSLLERLKSMLCSSFTWIFQWSADQMTPLMHKHGILPGMKGSDIFSRSQLLIANVDYSLEFPLAIYPHIITAGGLTTQPAQDLTQVN